MGIEDRDRTSVHEIHCRDRLWQTFVQMSEEQDKSVEELINDAMTGFWYGMPVKTRVGQCRFYPGQ